MPEKVGDLAYIIVDCIDNERVAAFWGQVLGREIGEHSPPYIDLAPAQEHDIPISFQKVDEPKTTKNRLHLDVKVSDLNVATEQIVALGGRMLQHLVEGPYTWRVMADPEGNEFCLVLN